PSLLLLFIFPFPGSSQFLDPACGIRSETKAVKRIINGKIAAYNSSPWMVFLKSTENKFICGGTLITNKLVLTAAHCFLPNVTLFVRLGEYKRSQKDVCNGNYCHIRATHKVDGGFRHRLYTSTGKNFLNDIAILRLATPVIYRDNIRPICILLDTRWRKYINNIPRLVGTGWGKTESGLDSDDLMTLDIRRQSPNVCRTYIGNNLMSNQFCAGNRNSNLCNGDSGGPVGAMIPYKKTKRFVQIGIASYTNQMCKYASVFTDVMSQIGFILKVWRQYGKGQTIPTGPPKRWPTRPPTRRPTKPPTRPPLRLPTRRPTKPPTRPTTKPTIIPPTIPPPIPPIPPTPPTIPPTTPPTPPYVPPPAPPAPPTNPPFVPPPPEPSHYEDGNWNSDSSEWDDEFHEDRSYGDSYESIETFPMGGQFVVQYPMQTVGFFG
ncbi:chymotrypsin-like protease CTRL-1, partial [Drosophila eugracilis]|uniref:chymotrypsin-like protease CTRL-1 n=1 Tax=Drosophila eugracilis TaxID=29029 RepID=UPI001BDADACD